MRIVYIIVIRTLDLKLGPVACDNSFTFDARNVSILVRLIVVRFKAEIKKPLKKVYFSTFGTVADDTIAVLIQI
jgi:hypothetical protein